MKLRVCLTALPLVMATPTAAGVATFDTLAEGFYDQLFSDDGITFYDIDCRLPGPYPGDFVIDDASASIPVIPEWSPFFTSPNLLGMLALSPGPEYSPSGFGELRMTTDRVESFASVDVFHSDGPNFINTQIVLEAYVADTLVASDSVLIFDSLTHHDLLTISGAEFETLRLSAEAPDGPGYFFGAIDNVVITPEPTVISLLALGALSTRRKRVSL